MTGGGRIRNRGALSRGKWSATTLTSNASAPPSGHADRTATGGAKAATPTCQLSTLLWYDVRRLEEPRLTDASPLGLWPQVYTEHWNAIAQSLSDSTQRDSLTPIKPHKLYLLSSQTIRDANKLRASGITTIIDISLQGDKATNFDLSKQFSSKHIRASHLISCLRILFPDIETRLGLPLDHLACQPDPASPETFPACASSSDVSTDDDSCNGDIILVYSRQGPTLSTTIMVALLMCAQFQGLPKDARPQDLTPPATYFSWLAHHRPTLVTRNPIFEAQVALLYEFLFSILTELSIFPGVNLRDRRRAQIDYVLTYLDAYFATGERSFGESISYLSLRVLTKMDEISLCVLKDEMGALTEVWLEGASQVQNALVYWQDCFSEVEQTVQGAHSRLIEDFWISAPSREALRLRNAANGLGELWFPRALFWSLPQEQARRKLISMCLGLKEYDVAEYGAPGQGPIGWSFSALLTSTLRVSERLLHTSKLVAVSQAWSWRRWAFREFSLVFRQLNTHLQDWNSLGAQDFVSSLWSLP